ncbi:Electroneutral sodium bicarbonate exchanger 1 [Seminavis robusta]|uniref:Electroneutral sodium bicarbonate exchanger 1 n=1 Tax=Seminavis robusta TaxID=568900 RepID=A0A9N8EPZ1_9STRA|nr:Electroneutral sodium bicarbonate exchanger 1 [Seminavis robusta]|eukprot:Sro1523_g279570.1 Electroneutral sodium bicarbonate exchanger 1 (643) ;mRNA; r:16363-18291
MKLVQTEHPSSIANPDSHMKTAREYKEGGQPRLTLPTNEEIDPNAGKVALDPAQPWGSGILGDIKRTVGTHWFAEMTNFNQKTIAVSCLIFISIIPPTLAFGASYGKMSNQKMGAIETILATSWIGIAYSLIGGMPMCIIGSTGPALAISTAIKNIAEGAGIEYINWNAWISIWLFGYCFAAGFFDLTRYVRLATRFTDEIFALLIVAIFVMDAVGDPFSPSGILRYLDPSHRSHGEYEDEVDYEYLTVGFLSVILGFGTTALIFFFRSFKFSSFFCSDMIRTSVHDFAVTMSVVFWTLIKELLFPEVQTEGLQVPDKFEPSFQCCTEACDTFWPDECPEQEASVGARNWFVDLGGVPSWAPFAAAGPAIMAFLLCYLDNGITWHLINHKHHKLTHGEAYNYDLCLNGLFNCVNGLMGLPWLVATTVPCIIHLNSLAEKDAHGEFLSVQETRLTMFFSHLFLGLTMAALSVLKLLPLPVLYGVFLFMGLSSLPGIQFWNRFLLFFQQPSRYPETVFLKYIESKRVHMYTVFQMCFFAGIFVVMNVKAISIAFPFMTFLCIPSRLFFLPKFFAGWELTLLDGEEDQIEAWVQLKQDSVRDFKLQQDKTGAMDDDSVDTPEPLATDLPAVSVAEAKFLSDDISV